jgi:hypothetical protein
MLINPNRNPPEDVLMNWAARVSQVEEYGNVPQAPNEGCLVGTDGLLQIDWPSSVADGAHLTLDVLLATATHPTLAGEPPSYPSARTIADAWRTDREGNVEYFRENQRHGVTTFQDEDIRVRLKEA